MSRVLPYGIYFGQVIRVDDKTSSMSFRVKNPCGTSNTGTWMVPLARATFTVNSDTSTEQGNSYDLTLQEWERMWMRSSSWRVQYSADGLWIGDGPNPGCQAG